ncbi:MAG: response regulator [Candidatus Obscuribacterales bacterium]|nr:response regulator [Cyanobacteria bacterium HKST-UBA01]MCB9471870.1 response regulator [Candidatus Obscuribacterales bacterium]
MAESVLVIDDEKSIREVLEIALEDRFQVYLASSGSQGLEMARELKPDLILLDRMMPEKDGIATLKELRLDDSTKGLPVIFLTARVQTQDMSEYDGLDVLGVLSKPFDPMSLSDEIDSMLQRASDEKSQG